MKKTLLALCALMSFCLGMAQTGSKESPLSVDDFLDMGIPTGATADTYLKGYIVGYIATGDTNVPTFTAEGCNQATNILLGGSSSEDEYDYCIPVQLPAGDIRNALNLKDHPENIGHEIILCGSREKYFSVAGLKSVNWYQWVGDAPVGGSTEKINGIDEKFASIPSDWTNVAVSGDKTYYATSFSGVTYAAMTGYKGTTPPFDAWLISPVVDIDKCADKKLSFQTQVNGYGATTTEFEVYVLNSNNPSTATKTKLNPALATAPESGYSGWVESGDMDLSSFKGNIYVGFRYHATEDANYATWCVTDVQLNANAVVEPETKTYTVAEAIALGTGVDLQNQKVKGYIVGYVNGASISEGCVFAAGADASASNLLMADSSAETDYTKCIPLQLLSGSAIRSALNLKDNPDNLGKFVTVTGEIVKYFGVVGIKNPTAYELEGTSVVPAEGIIYESLKTDNEGWDYEYIKELAAPLEYVWYWSAQYGMCASSYKDGEVYDADVYAVSPAIDLKDYADVVMTFRHAANKFTLAPEDQCSVEIREVGGEWKKLDVPVWPEGTDWSFVDSGEVSLKAYEGKKVQIGFHYDVTTAEGGGTWEISTLAVNGKAGAGVSAVEDASAPVMYFNLQGVRVADPTEGVYIVRQGSSAKKVIL